MTEGTPQKVTVEPEPQRFWAPPPPERTPERAPERREEREPVPA